MSLHNSTMRTNYWTFLIGLIIEISKAKLCTTLQDTNQKPSEAGFDLRGGTAKHSGVFDLGLPWAETKRADADFDEIKLIRAQGECLGIRSR